MFRYRLHSPDGDDLGEATYAMNNQAGRGELTQGAALGSASTSQGYVHRSVGLFGPSRLWVELGGGSSG
jgi:hypothetical protein